MEDMQRKEILTRRSLRYTYYVSSPTTGLAQNFPALFFIHGFPDSAHLWYEVIAHLGDLPNKIIVPDCLGYAGSDKPQDTRLYAYKDQVDDIEDILKNEGDTSAIIIGHDWGSALAQRAYLHKRELFRGVVLLNTGYMVPSNQPFDLAIVNEITQKTLGYPQFSYWEFFTAPDAAAIVEGGLERMWQVLHGDVKDWMKMMFCVPNSMRNFMLGTQEVPLKPYAKQPKWRDRWMQQFKADGFSSSLQMYKATVSNVQTKSDSVICEGNLAIEVPLLYFICTQDAVCVPEMMAPAKTLGLVPNLTEVVLECGHWSPMEKPDEIATHLRIFVSREFSVK